MNIPTLRSPIVFAHGLMGFDEIRLGRWRVARYWCGLPERLAEAGNRVLVARVAPLGSVAERAGQLKQFIQSHSPHEPVHIFAHSMGGLDSRYMISCLGMAPRVLTLTTIGTPHRGTPFADWGLRRLEPIFRMFIDVFCLSRRAIQDLTVAACKVFNQFVQDSPLVRYLSVAGQYRRDWFHPEWSLSSRVIEREQGPNDGLVPVESARYGESCEVWDGDHISLVNFPNLFDRLRGVWQDRLPAFARMLGRLRDEGF